MQVNHCARCGRTLAEGPTGCPDCEPGSRPSSLAFPFRSLSIIIPAYNEAARIGSTVRQILEYASGRLAEFELLVVDDGSQDDTVRVVEDEAKSDPRVRVIRNPVNRGKGYSVRAGALQARMEQVLFTDADHSTPIEELQKLAAFASPTTLVIASRGLASSELEIRQPWYRETMGKTFNVIVQTLLVPGVHDTQCGFKLFGRQVVDAIFPALETERWAFDVEVVARAIRLGFEVREVPVRWKNDERSRVHPIVDSSRMLLDVIRVWWKLRS
jgi:dolichyl-phosphate beta-glucosyltransferase